MMSLKCGKSEKKVLFFWSFWTSLVFLFTPSALAKFEPHLPYILCMKVLKNVEQTITLKMADQRRSDFM